MGKRTELSPSKRMNIFVRDRFTCQFCGRSAPDVPLEVDHICPVSHGGKNDYHNLVTICRDCNAGKGDKISKEFYEHVLRHDIDLPRDDNTSKIIVPLNEFDKRSVEIIRKFLRDNFPASRMSVAKIITECAHFALNMVQQLKK